MIVVLALGAFVALALVVTYGSRLFARSVADPVGTVLPIYALLLPFGSGIHIPLPLPSAFGSLSSLAGAWAIVAIAAHMYTTRRVLTTNATVCVLFVLLLGVAFFTYLWSVSPGITSSNLFVLLSVMVLFLLGALIEVDPRSLRRVEVYAIIGAVIACLYGVWLLRTGRLVSHDQGPARFATAGGVGDAADPNITAATLVLPFLLALFTTVRERRRIQRFGALAATLLIGYGILLTGSRGGGIAIVVGVLIIAWHQGGGRTIARGAIALAVGSGLALTLLPSTISSRFSSSTTSGRAEIWTAGLQACKTYCWRGSGWSTFPTVYQNEILTHPKLIGHYGILDFKAHNMWLGLLIEGGILALVLAAAGLYSLLRNIWNIPAARRAVPLAGFVALLVSNFFLSNFNFKYFWFMLLYAALAVNVLPLVNPPDDQLVSATGTQGSFASRGTKSWL